jgi:plasmid stabilization system protein ParE
MSMLTFYINRAGKTLPAAQRRRLEAAKAELRRLFGRPAAGRPRAKVTSSRRRVRRSRGSGGSRKRSKGARR